MLKELVKLYVDVRDKHKPKYLPLHSKEGVTAGLQKDMHRRIRDCVQDSKLKEWLHKLVTPSEENGLLVNTK